MKKGGFTLIEMLVVIAIISILAALLAPTLHKAQQAALALSCSNNLKQFGAATYSYLGDNENYMPIARKDPTETNTGVFFTEPDGATRQFELGWESLLWPYIKQTGLYCCPASESNFTSREYRCTYGINCGYNLNHFNDGYTGVTDPYNSSSQINKIRKPSLTIMIGERQIRKDFPVYRSSHTYTQIYYYQIHNEGYEHFFRHEDRFNMVFADGHAKTHYPIEVDAQKHWNRRGY